MSPWQPWLGLSFPMRLDGLTGNISCSKVSALPSFLVTIALMFMLESPRFILCKGREHKTIRDRDLYFTNIGKDRAGEDQSTGGVSMEKEDPYQDRVNDKVFQDQRLAVAGEAFEVVRKGFFPKDGEEVNFFLKPVK